MNNKIPIAPIGELALPTPSYSDILWALAERPLEQTLGSIEDVEGLLVGTTLADRKLINEKLGVINRTLSDPRLTNTQAAMIEGIEWLFVILLLLCVTFACVTVRKEIKEKKA